MSRKGIILAGGLGTRMYPLTIATSKQLLPIYDKPMIFYQLSILINSGIKEILIISTEEHIDLFKILFGNGKELGISIDYKVQKKPKGIAQAIILAEEFLKKSDFCLILGDNIIFGDDNEISKKLNKAFLSKNATIFSKSVKFPEKYGVASFKKNKLIKLIEKPKKFISNQAIVGLYFYPNSAVKESKKLKFSKRGELEITDLNNIYIKKNKMDILRLSKKIFWYDAGSHKDYFKVTKKVYYFQLKFKKSIANIHELVFKKKYVNKKIFKQNILKYSKSSYGDYLKK